MKDFLVSAGCFLLFVVALVEINYRMKVRAGRLDAGAAAIDPIAVIEMSAMKLDHALAIVLTFGGNDLAMSMEERKTLNRARDVVDQSANLLIGREPKKFGGRHG